jgi:beta-glucanase (GH16 family)
VVRTKNRVIFFMTIRNIPTTVLILGSCFIAQLASAQWTLVDNLTTHATGALAGQTAADGGTWTGIGGANTVVIGPSATTGNAAVLTGDPSPDGAVWLPMPTPIASANQTAETVFFQFDVGSTPSAGNVNWDLETVGDATDSQGISGDAQNAVEFNIDSADAGSRSGITIRNGAIGFVEMSTVGSGTTPFTPASGTLYSAWVVINQNAQTYNVYLAGGGLGSSPVKMYIATATGNNPTFTTNQAAGFRNTNSGVTPNDFVFGTGNTDNTDNPGVYNIYQDPNKADLTSPVGVPSTQLNIVWSDEFNGTSINTNNWTFETGNNNGWGNSELEYYTSSTNNAYVSNGLLHIAVLEQSIGGFDFSSARMKTEGLYNTPTYGILQWRAALPSGTGMWPALWLLGSDYSTVGWPNCGEIDVVENSGTPDFVQGSLHSGTSSNEISSTKVYDLPGGESTTNFHIYQLNWSASAIQFVVDGVIYETQGAGAPFNAPFFFIMNVAVGGNYTGNPSVATIEAGTTFPQEMLVDYVRVYEQTEPLAISATASNGNVVLSWPANIVCHLQAQTNTLAVGSWSDLSVTTSPFVVAPGPNQTSVFYRLASP